MTNKYRLMVPGPTPLPPEVIAAAIMPIEDERTSRYAAVFARVLGNLQRTLLTRNDVLLFAASMTGAFEGAIQNLCSPGDRVLVLNNGAFGQRWVDLARSFGLHVVDVADDWGRAADMTRVAEAVAATPGLSVAIAVHCETSTGAVNDVRAFARACGDVVTVIDSASGVGACELRTDDWGIDVVIGGSQKALMTPPGLAFASVSQRAWGLHRRASLPRFYFDWDAAIGTASADVPRTPWTPAISLISQLDVALRRLHGEGMEAVFARHVRLGQAVRAGILGMGLRLFSPDDPRSATLTAAELPETVSATQLVQHLLQRYGVQFTDGLGHMADRILRIGHCGYIDELDIITGISAIELALHDLGHHSLIGAGVRAALLTLAGQESEAENAPNTASIPDRGFALAQP